MNNRSMAACCALVWTANAFCQAPRIIRAECFWGPDPGTGQGTPMIATDGNLSNAFEQVTANVPSGSGPQRFSVRVQGADTVWGPVVSVVVEPLALHQAGLELMEMFWDEDPSTGSPMVNIVFNGAPYHAFEQVTGTILLTLAPGMHRYSVRSVGPGYSWGAAFSGVVEVLEKRVARLSNAEYFWDADPGEGQGLPLGASDGNFSSTSEPAGGVVNVAGLPTGPHVLHTRMRGVDNVWGPVFRTVVHVDPQPTITVSLDLRVALQGCMGSTLMTDQLRVAGLIPTVEPYSALGYDLGPDAGTTLDPSVLTVSFPPTAAVVDWVLVEFHPYLSTSQVTVSMPLLLRRGGTIATANGQFPILFSIPPGSYYVVVRHRDHLSASTANAVGITTNGTSFALDLTAAPGATFGTNSTVLVGTKYCLWSGDTDHDGTIKYTGSGNDRDPVLVNVGSTTPNNAITGYSGNDVNMDGVTKYTGTGNDRDPILVNVGSTTPNNVRQAQLP